MRKTETQKKGEDFLYRKKGDEESQAEFSPCFYSARRSWDRQCMVALYNAIIVHSLTSLEVFVAWLLWPPKDHGTIP